VPKSPSRQTLFIADLHLCEDRPGTNGVFFDFLENTAADADSLYILGDLFEAWVGDDDLEAPLHNRVAQALKRLTVGSVPVFLMHGNRDFLLAERFCAASGVQLIPDPSRIDLYDTPTLLMHGDTLCTDDIAYQQFRGRVRDPAWQRQFLNLPLAARKAQAVAVREMSEEGKPMKSLEIMDVSPAGVVEAFRNCGCPRLIHGHTHRPARHALTVDGMQRERWVLPAWYEGGGYVACTPEGCRLIALPS
jgi:UDP-2,3-diacylglucosamine hydrolase